MAGLGETCTHVASLLFAVDSIVKVRDSRTVTEEPAYWLLPSPLKNIEYKEMKDIDFTSAKSKKKKLDVAIESVTKKTLPSSSSSSLSTTSQSSLSRFSHNSAAPSSNSSSSTITSSEHSESSFSVQPIKQRKTRQKVVPETTETEEGNFFAALSNIGANSSILSLTEP